MTNENVLSQQEVFNQVADHLLTQMKRSYSKKHKGCQYRGPNGLKCAVGGILTDDEVDINNNGGTVYSIYLPDRLKDQRSCLRLQKEPLRYSL